MDNGRICLPSNLPAIPESLESKLDSIDNTLDDPLQRGFGGGALGAEGLCYSAQEIQNLLYQVRRAFGAILAEIVENTKQLSHNGTRSLEEIRTASRSRRFSVARSPSIAADISRRFLCCVTCCAAAASDTNWASIVSDRRAVRGALVSALTGPSGDGVWSQVWS